MNPLAMNPRAQRLCVWTGPVLVFIFFIAMVLVAGYIPPPSPQDSADKIAAWYRNNLDGIRIGVLLEVMCVALFAPWGASIAIWTRRHETGFPVLTYTQLICLGFVLVDAFFVGMVWGVAAFRPDEIAAESTRTWNDFGWFLYLFTWPPFSVWCIAIALGIFWDKSENPTFPRWVAYLNLWVAVLLVPAGLMLFFKHGPFSFNGVITFWVPTVVFFSWIIVMTYAVLRAIKAEELRAGTAEARATAGEPVALSTEKPAGVAV